MDTKVSSVRIVLHGIFKNEASIIGRCIHSALPIVDAVHMEDTGSTDQSCSVITNAIHTHPPTALPLNAHSINAHTSTSHTPTSHTAKCIPHRITHEPWQDFGYNRTHALESARQFVRDLGWDLSLTYLLLMDADMVLRTASPLNKDALVHDQYIVEQKTVPLTNSNRYWNVRLIKCSVPFTVQGATHEYYDSSQLITSERCCEIWIEDQCDGSNRVDKYARDEQLLLQDMKKNPNNARAYFYLAQTCRFRNNPQYNDLSNAIGYYERVLALGSWEEEQWYSMYCLAMCYADQGKWGQAMSTFLDAYQRRPTRVEPLFQIAEHYQKCQQHHVAMIFLQFASQIPYPKDDILFVEERLYTYAIHFAIALSAFYTKEFQAGYMALEKMMRVKNKPVDVHGHGHFLARCYFQPLRSLSNRVCITERPTTGDDKDTLRVCNSSTCWWSDNMVIWCRQRPHGNTNDKRALVHHHTKTDDSKGEHVLLMLSTSYIASMNQKKTVGGESNACNAGNDVNNTLQLLDTRVSSQMSSEIQVKRIRHLQEGPTALSLDNLVNVRLFVWQEKLWCCASILDHVSPYTPRMCLCELDELGGTSHDIFVKSLTFLSGYNDHQVQQNWLPFVDEEHLFFICGYNPFTILRYTTCVEVHRRDSWSVASSSFRGSAGPLQLPFGLGWLLVVHEVSGQGAQQRSTQRLIWLTHDFRLRRMSPMFYFVHAEGVEMCRSLLSAPSFRLSVSGTTTNANTTNFNTTSANTTNSNTTSANAIAAQFKMDQLIQALSTSPLYFSVGVKDHETHLLTYSLGFVLRWLWSTEDLENQK